MIGAERFFTDTDGPAREGLALRKPAARVFQAAEVVINRGHLGVLRAQRFGSDGQRALIELGSFVETRGVLVKHRQIVENLRELNAVRPERLFGERERAPIKRLGVRVASLSPVKPSQAVQHLNVEAVHVLGASGVLHHAERAQIQTFRVVIAFFALVGGSQGMDDVGDVGVFGAECGFEDLDGTKAEWPGSSQLALATIGHCLVVELDGQCHGIKFPALTIHKGCWR